MTYCVFILMTLLKLLTLWRCLCLIVVRIACHVTCRVGVAPRDSVHLDHNVFYVLACIRFVMAPYFLMSVVNNASHWWLMMRVVYFLSVNKDSDLCGDSLNPNTANLVINILNLHTSNDVNSCDPVIRFYSVHLFFDCCMSGYLVILMMETWLSVLRCTIFI